MVPIRSPLAVRERLATARLYLCTDARRERGDLDDFLRAALAGGVDIVQLRDKSLEAREELEILELMRPIVTEHGALLAVNDRADVAQLAGAQVFHTGQGDLPTPASRSILGPGVVLGRSTHSVEQAREAEADPEIDYFCVGPLWSTPTKPGRQPVGLDTLAAVAAEHPSTPWFAIGGIDADRARAVVDAGAGRIVVVRAITRAADPEAAARELRAVLERA